MARTLSGQPVQGRRCRTRISTFSIDEAKARTGEEAVLRFPADKHTGTIAGHSERGRAHRRRASIRRWTVASATVIGCLLTAAPGASASPDARAAQAVPCTFEVLHNDHIGRLSVPKGTYQLTLFSPAIIDCARAQKAFATFLQDFDGRLPRPWSLDVATRTFRRGAPDIAFSITRVDRGPAARHLPSGTRKCPGTFDVENNDRVGVLTLPRGPYFVYVFGGSGLSCRAADRLFASFLTRPSGALPRPWRVIGQTGTFRNGRRPGFKVKPARAL